MRRDIHLHIKPEEDDSSSTWRVRERVKAPSSTLTSVEMIIQRRERVLRASRSPEQLYNVFLNRKKIEFYTENKQVILLGLISISFIYVIFYLFNINPA